MVEKDKIFSSYLKYTGLFDFGTFYKFCYDYLTGPEFGLDVIESQYVEKIKGDKKDIDFEWVGTKKISDYFKYEVKFRFKIFNLEKVEVVKDNIKVKMDKTTLLEIKISSSLMRDYEGRFELSAFKKFLRTIYEKWIIPSRIEYYQTELISDSDKFLAQAKAYLDLSGKR